MSRDTFDAVLASTPQGSTAGKVTSRGTHWTPEAIDDGKLHWTAPPPMQPYVDDGNIRKPPNLTGLKVGRLTVVGVLHERIKSRSRWVVRCACGDYEVRRTKYLNKIVKNGATLGTQDGHEGRIADRCHNCSELNSIQHKYKTLGPKPIEEFFEPSNLAAKRQAESDSKVELSK